jgi:response regulator NasT
LRIAVADDERDMRQFFEELLPRLGHEVVAVAGNGQELVERCRSTRPDLVITDIKMPDLDGIDAAAAVNREKLVPVILLTGHHDTQLVARAGAEYVMAYLIKPVKPVELETTIRLAMVRFGHFQVLHAEAASLRQALEARKLVERAKGVLMKRLHLDEPEAFRRLKKLAADHNSKLAELAQNILAADEIFQALE